jgi:hypothetical protein
VFNTVPRLPRPVRVKEKEPPDRGF